MPKANAPNTRAATVATAKSWKRSRKLADITDTKPGQARTFLGKNKIYNIICDVAVKGKLDKRDPKVRSMFKDYASFITAFTGRKSAGDKTKAPRAGAPPTEEPRTKRSYTKRTNTNDHSNILNSIRAVQKLHGVTLNDIIYNAILLGKIIGEKIDTDKVIADAKTAISSLENLK